MRAYELTSIGAIIRSADQIRWDLLLCFPEINPCWTEDMPVMMVDGEDVVDDGTPEEASKHGLSLVDLFVSDVQDVMCNYFQQTDVADMNALLKALKYYKDNDAYIVLS